VRLFRRFDTRIAGAICATGTDGALGGGLCPVPREGNSKHVRVVRISYTLSRDTTRFTHMIGIFGKIGI
jgi:hypothetical protein